ncbi:MAG: ABC transporter permease [Thermoleophilaceae bacterium]|nr:ABC transporter permease [Thermoleophilaceae bacterium]
MTTTLAHTWFMTKRQLRFLIRQPVWIFVTLTQPVIWLLLYGALFKKVVEIPGFRGGNYIEFLTPGVVVMTALFSAGWSGMGQIDDIDRGVLDRFLISPARRSSLITGRLFHTTISVSIQSAIILVLALITGATFDGGVGGALVLIAISALLSFAVGAASNAVGLLVRREETLIALMQFLLLPLTFLSSAFMQKSLMPGWMQTVSDVNPVNWAIEAGRGALGGDWDWGLIGSRAGLLLALSILAGLWAVSAFRTYQRTV